MESVRCYLCDHEFVEGEEPWLMFEKRLRQDGHIECSLADLLSSVLQEPVVKLAAHSTLLCDSCNVDLLEYESMEKRFSQLREKIMQSYAANVTVHNLNNMDKANNSDISETAEAETQKFLLVGEDQYLVEEVEDLDCNGFADRNDLDIMGIKTDNTNSMDQNYDFSAFDEHVAQNSLPPGVLNLSDGLINLTDVDNIPIDEDIIIYDVTSNQLLLNELIVPSDMESDRNVEEYKDVNEEDLNFIISPEGFPGEHTNSIDIIGQNNDDSVNDDEINANKPVCKQFGSNFLCFLCEIPPLSARATLAEHLQTFHNSKLYMCGQCHEGFGRKQDLKAHSEAGHKLECTVCEQVLSNRRLFRIHKRLHENTNKPFECTVCQKKYGSKGMLEEHMYTHTGVRPYKCSECPKDFASKYTLHAHMKIHKERPRPFQCDMCGKQFLNSQNLSQHKKLHVSAKSFECNVCNKAFATQHSLYVHQVVHSGQRPFICRICGKSFARRPEIKDHERTHTGERPYKCDLCPKAFAQRSNLTSHKKNTHLNQKLHKCEHCLRSFKRKRLLEYHIQAAHTGERPHRCEICGAGFVYPEHFKKHMLIHSGKKPFACEVCGKQFNSRDNRNAHRFVHSNKKPYECMECGAGFMRKPQLLSHMKQTKHANDTIIINQPQISHQIFDDDDEYTNIETNTLEEEDVDNEYHVDDSQVNYNGQEILTPDTNSASIGNGEHEEEIETVDNHFIKDGSRDEKYLQFEDLERDQTLTWVDIEGT